MEYEGEDDTNYDWCTWDNVVTWTPVKKPSSNACVKNSQRIGITKIIIKTPTTTTIIIIIIIIIKKKICKIVDFAVPAGHRIKLKEREKKDKYLDLARELKKKLWNMRVTIIPIVIGAFGTVTKGLLKGLADLDVGAWEETIIQQHYWKRLEYWEESWRLEETCCHSISSKRPSADGDVKNSNK